MSSENATKWLRGGVIAGLGAAGVSLIGYVIEHGELPEWMPKAFDWVWSGVTVSAPWALWELMIPVMIIGLSAAYFLHTEGQKVFRLEDRITALQQQLKKVKTENSELLAENNRLKLPPPSEPEHPPQQSLTERQYNLLMIIAECENESVITTSSNLLQASRLQKVVMNSTLDDLMGVGYIVRIKMGFDNKYVLTATGRKFVVSEEQA
jgi:predicted transcriptional regulator